MQTNMRLQWYCIAAAHQVCNTASAVKKHRMLLVVSCFTE